MWKRFLSFVIAVFLVIFILQNFDIVEMQFIFGPPVQIPLAIAIGIGFLSGYALSFFSNKIRMFKERKKNLEAS
ncbi:MAG: hypothetical protein HQM13_21865 [SAR324 cluster bacterium]|nr:hypothetical protein [SAR324 cluster bacterium]